MNKAPNTSAPINVPLVTSSSHLKEITVSASAGKIINNTFNFRCEHFISDAFLILSKVEICCVD